VGKTTELRQKLKQRFFPFLESKGFSCDMRHAPQIFTFRRISGDKICVLDVQWDEYGRRRFALNFSAGSPREIISYEGKISPQDAFVPNFKNRGRLKSNHQLRLFRSDQQWFSQDLGIIERLMCKREKSSDHVIDDLLSVFSEVEDFFEERKIGSHLNLWPN
jgi:hypothetical protein